MASVDTEAEDETLRVRVGEAVIEGVNKEVIVLEKQTEPDGLPDKEKDGSGDADALTDRVMIAETEIEAVPLLLRVGDTVLVLVGKFVALIVDGIEKLFEVEGDDEERVDREGELDTDGDAEFLVESEIDPDCDEVIIDEIVTICGVFV